MSGEPADASAPHPAAWAAGVFEVLASFGVDGDAGRVELRIVWHEKEVLEAFARAVGGEVYRDLPSAVWTSSGPDLADALLRIGPHVRVRRGEVSECLHVLEARARRSARASSSSDRRKERL